MITKPTSEQQKIIETEGNVVVTARPGSGKTYTIVEKIAGILENVPEYQGVIAISYTNKASDELKRRCKNKGIDLKSSFFGTIDKFYTNQIIRPFACHLTKKYIPLEIEKGIPDGSEYELLKGSGDKTEFTSEQAALVLKMLERGFIFLPLSGAVALYITKQIPEVLVYLKARFTHIFIDEYQDCGAVQHEFFLYLVHNHIWGVAVGDPDQAIDTLASYMPAKDDEVNVMTIHKSKGLEFSIVFILDLYKYVFSNNYEKKESENSNQALNLYYVAITRAKDAVYFLNASERSNKNGGVFRAHPSELYFLPGLEQLRKDVIW